jgi:hypothetical protein
MLEIPPHVRREQPVHPARQVAILKRSNHQVKVIRHETISEQPHRKPNRRLPNGLEEGGIVPDLGGKPRPEHCLDSTHDNNNNLDSPEPFEAPFTSQSRSNEWRVKVNLPIPPSLLPAIGMSPSAGPPFSWPKQSECSLQLASPSAGPE